MGLAGIVKVASGREPIGDRYNNPSLLALNDGVAFELSEEPAQVGG